MTDNIDIMDELDVQDMAVDGYDADASDDETGQLYEHFRFEADPGMQPLRVDKYMCEKLPHSSRNRIQTAADAGFVHVNGRPVKSNFKVRPGDVVTLMLDRPRHDTSIVAEDLPINVVYEDDDLMVVNKEAGMVVHPGAGNFTGTLVNAIAWHLRNVESYDPNDPEVGLVHRIDKDTSGLLVVAKTPKAKTSLGLQFFNKTTHRSYNAVVWGNLTEDEGRIEHDCDAARVGYRQGSGDSLARDRALRLCNAHRMPTGDGPYPSDTCPHEAYRTSAFRRRTIWRHGDIARRTLGDIQGFHTELLQDMPASGSACTHTGLRPSVYTQADGLYKRVAV